MTKRARVPSRSDAKGTALAVLLILITAACRSGESTSADDPFAMPVAVRNIENSHPEMEEKVDAWDYPDVVHADGTITRMIWMSAGEGDAYAAMVQTLPKVQTKAVTVERVPGFMKQYRWNVENGQQGAVAPVLDALMMRGKPIDVDEVTAVVLGIQTSIPEIDISIRVVEVLESDAFAFGIDMTWASREKDPDKPSETFFDKAATALGLPEIPGRAGRITSGAAPPLLLDLGTISNGVQVDFLIRALELFNKTNVLSSPHIAVLDGHGAQIVAGEEIPFLSPTVNPFGQSLVTTQFKRVGVKLYVTPKVVGRHLIRINLTTAVESVTGETAFETNNLKISNPIISSRQASTVMDVHDGDTAIIGGLLTQSTLGAENRVPVLGELPVIGYLFSSRSQQTQQTNLIFFLTPKIIDPSRDHRRISPLPPVAPESKPAAPPK